LKSPKRESPKPENRKISGFVCECQKKFIKNLRRKSTSFWFTVCSRNTGTYGCSTAEEKEYSVFAASSIRWDGMLISWETGVLQLYRITQERKRAANGYHHWNCNT
jgi:hypothetical protein